MGRDGARLGAEDGGGARDMKGKGTERREVVGGREEKKRGLWRRDTGVRRTSE